jgi:hypothetical protein
MDMKGMKWIVAAAALMLAGGVSASAAGKTKTDKEALMGTWYVAQGVYTDGSLEKELEMQFSFKQATMTNPMEDEELSYTLDEKARTITAKDARSSVWIRYTLVDAQTMTFQEMKVSTPKGVTVIVGSGGTFKELDLKKKG